MAPQSNNLLGMMLDLAQHEVFTDEEILDEVTMFYVVREQQLMLHTQPTQYRLDTRPQLARSPSS